MWKLPIPPRPDLSNIDNRYSQDGLKIVILRNWRGSWRLRRKKKELGRREVRQHRWNCVSKLKKKVEEEVRIEDTHRQLLIDKFVAFTVVIRPGKVLCTVTIIRFFFLSFFLLPVFFLLWFFFTIFLLLRSSCRRILRLAH